MPLFRMDKWYGDLLTGDGHYLFFYCTALRMAGGVQTRLSITSARPGECRTVTRETELFSLACDADRSGIATRHGGVRFSGRGGVADFRFPDTELSLRFSDVVPGGGDPMVVRAPGGSLRWFPCALSAGVTGTVTVQGERVSFTGVRGYADYVHSHIPPPLAPVRTVVWGRFHGNGESLTYSLLVQPSGGIVAKLYAHAGGTLRSFDDVGIDWHQGRRESDLGLSIPVGYDLTARCPQGAVRIAVTHGRAAVQSEFLDADAVRSPGLRAFYRWFSMNPRGVKFVSTAVMSSSIPAFGDRRTDPLPGVGEYVVFGRG